MNDGRGSMAVYRFKTLLHKSTDRHQNEDSKHELDHVIHSPVNI